MIRTAFVRARISEAPYQFNHLGIRPRELSFALATRTFPFPFLALFAVDFPAGRALDRFSWLGRHTVADAADDAFEELRALFLAAEAALEDVRESEALAVELCRFGLD